MPRHLVRRKTQVPFITLCSPYEHSERHLFLIYMPCLNDHLLISYCVEHFCGKDESTASAYSSVGGGGGDT